MVHCQATAHTGVSSSHVVTKVLNKLLVSSVSFNIYVDMATV